MRKRGMQALPKINISPKPLTGEVEWLIIAGFMSGGAQSLKLEIHATAGWSLVGTEVLLWGQRAEAREQMVWFQDTLVLTGTDNSLPGVHLGEVAQPLRG